MCRLNSKETAKSTRNKLLCLPSSRYQSPKTKIINITTQKLATSTSTTIMSYSISNRIRSWQRATNIRIAPCLWQISTHRFWANSRSNKWTVWHLLKGVSLRLFRLLLPYSTKIRRFSRSHKMTVWSSTIWWQQTRAARTKKIPLLLVWRNRVLGREQVWRSNRRAFRKGESQEIR